jgi:hypothetical protein
MNTASTHTPLAAVPDLRGAEDFIWRNARLIDRHRYAYLFRGGSADAVVAALLPYQNPDGGFGNALEPDSRGPSSHPAHLKSSFEILDEVDRLRGPLVEAQLRFLQSVTTSEGGVPLVLPSVREAAHPEWWSASEEGERASLMGTAVLAGYLHKRQVEHPWLTRATAYCWQQIEALEQTSPYEVEFCLPFLDHVPDRPRAVQAAERLGRLVREQQLVWPDRDLPIGNFIAPGYGPHEAHTPLDYAPHPRTLARTWFTDVEIERDLAVLARAQGDDGGWYFNWREWNLATTVEWRAIVTIGALTTLTAYGRLAGVTQVPKASGTA